MAKQDYKKMKKVELVALCHERGLSPQANLTNAELIKLLENDASLSEALGEKPKKASPKKESADSLRNKAFGSSDFKPKVYRDNPEMLTIDSDDRFKKRDLHSKDDEELKLSFTDQKHILTAEVIGTTNSELMSFGNGSEKVNVVHAICKFGTRHVFIPSLLFFENAKDIPNDKIYQYMQARVGSVVDFTVISIDEEFGEPKYYGSRINALKQLRCDYWYSRVKKSNIKSQSEYPYLIQDGQIIEAKVVAVSKNVMFVEAFGAEAKVHAGDVAYEVVTDVRQYYAPGDRVVVRVSDIKLDDTPNGHASGYPVSFNASHKDAVEDPRKSFFKNYKMNSTYKGTVTKKLLTEKNLVFFVNTGELDVHCVMAEGVGMIPDAEDQVTFRIKGYQEKTCRLWGEIIHVFPKKRAGNIY